MPNTIYVISPYWFAGTWVFDDPQRDLHAEPFVSGAPEILTALVTEAGIEPQEARRGFRLVFSAGPFPGHQGVARRGRPDAGGTWYEVNGREGWLCPALFRYYDEAPEAIYLKAEALQQAPSRP